MKNASAFPALIALFILSALFFISAVYANDIPDKSKFFEKVLQTPHPYYGPTDDPPPGPVIAIAEWEPATGVLVAWPLQIPVSLVAEMVEDVEVWTTVVNVHQMEDAVDAYLNAGIDTSICHFLFIEQGIGPYTRDHGPWYIINGDDEQGMISNDYEAGGNCMPPALGDTLGIPVYETGLRSEGGNYQTDGMGRAIVTEWVLVENPFMTAVEIDQLMLDYLGITSHIVRQVNPNYYHVDTFAKLIDPGRIMVIDPIGGDPSIELNVEYFESMLSPYGRPYEVFRVQGSGYSNTLFLNDKVLVPLFGDPTDSMALVSWAEAMPGYEVQGFFWNSFNYGDALHCRTHEMADRYMLRIVHVPIHDRENDGNNYHLTANIRPYSNEPLTGSPFIIWRTDGGTYNYTPMTLVSGYDYEGYISQQPDGSEIEYYLEAEDGSGRTENHPYIGAGNPHHFQVGPDMEPPVVVMELPDEIFTIEWPLEVTVYALDNRWVSSVTLEYLINGVPQEDIELPLEEPFAVYYTGIAEGNIQAGDVIELRTKVIDTSVNLNTTFSPDTGYHAITIIAPPILMVELTPATSPVYVLPIHGSFDFNIAVRNNTLNTETTDIWTMVTLPNGVEYGPIIEVHDFTIEALTIFDRDRTQLVPRIAPPGIYTYDAYIGDYPNTILYEDHFEFEKMDMEVDGDDENMGWNNWGEEFGETAGSNESIPTKFALHPAFPNPFNPTTTISYQLSAASGVTLTIYDITGREAATLVDGMKSAGYHSVKFDASGLSSGVYFVRLEAEEFRQVKKMLLVK